MVIPEIRKAPVKIYDKKELTVMKKMSKSDLNRWIGTQIFTARSTRKLSQEALAEAADVSRVFISQLENGNQSAKIDTYYRIACALDITLGELFRKNGAGTMEDILFLLNDCSCDEVRSFTEILRVIKVQIASLCK